MIELDVKGYCHNCSDFEPHAERLYIDDTACHTVVTCKYAERCEHIENYIRGEIKKGLKVPEYHLIRTGINICDMGSNGVRENGKRSTVKVDSSDIPSKYIRSDVSSKAHRSV